MSASSNSPHPFEEDVKRVLARLERERRACMELASGIPYPETDVAVETQPTPLPQLLDCKGLRAELGISRAAAEALMRQLDTVQIPGLRKVYVRRSDVAAYLDERTFAKDRVAA
jgi:hypothetical protein